MSRFVAVLLCTTAAAMILAPSAGAHRHSFGTKSGAAFEIGPVTTTVPFRSPYQMVTDGATQALRETLADMPGCGDSSTPIAASKLSRNKLRAIILAPTWYEIADGVVSRTPSPMGLSRGDGHPNLYDRYKRNTAEQDRQNRGYFWHPGIGAWQLDDQGIGRPYGRSRFSAFSALYAAREMASRFCASGGNLDRTFTPIWVACFPKNGVRRCSQSFSDLYSSANDQLRADHQQQDNLVDSTGGTRYLRRCKLGRAVNAPRATCAYVNPSAAQHVGDATWPIPSAYNIPLASPFYVMTQVIGGQGFERRVWLRSSGNITALRPLDQDSRLTPNLWRQNPVVMCDLTTGRGDC